MRYLEAPPPPLLRPAVVCHWAIESHSLQEPIHHTVYPDGCFDLLFVLGGGVDQLAGGYVVGPMTRAKQVRLHGSVDMIGVRFRPGVASRLFGLPMVELRDALVAATELLGSRAGELADRMAAAESFDARVTMLNAALEHWLQEPCGAPVTARLAGVDFGDRVGAVSGRLGISERQVQRLFLRDVGLTPTELARLRRFRRAMHRLRDSRAGRLSAIAADLGYSDHAHFTREFASFAGVPPSVFVREHGGAPDDSSDLFKQD